jgi:HAD superfamily hydrolase (TIGR01509 family)
MNPHTVNIHIPSNARGLIFDCDGTLVDSMPQHVKAWELALTSFGETYREDFFLSVKGMEEKEIIDLYNRTYGAQLNSARVVQKKHHYFREMIDSISPIQPVLDVVLRYRGKLPMAVVSGGARKNVLAELAAIRVIDCFKTVLTADDPFPPKPAPDLFLEAARLIAVPPPQCLVFEDADLGLAAAQKAGMQTIDIREFLHE